MFGHFDIKIVKLQTSGDISLIVVVRTCVSIFCTFSGILCGGGGSKANQYHRGEDVD